MSSFTKNLTITKIKVKKRKFWALWPKNKYKFVDMWRVDKTFQYRVGSEDSYEIITVPKGFISDGGSKPRFSWFFIGHPMDEGLQAYVLHDLLYTIKIYTRKRSDAIFYEAMGVLNIIKLKRIIIHQWVRRLGWIPWKKKKVKKGGPSYDS